MSIYSRCRSRVAPRSSNNNSAASQPTVARAVLPLALLTDRNPQASADAVGSAMGVLAKSKCGEFEVDDSFERLDLDKLHAILSKQYWNAGATREKVEACAKGSWVFGLYRGTGKGELVGYMRLVTDRRSFYYVSDVYVDGSLQGRGLGEFLIRTALSQPGIADSARGFLFTVYMYGIRT